MKKKKKNEQTSKTKEVQRIDEPFLQQKRKLGQFYAFISKKVQKRNLQKGHEEMVP